jgi:hypothetical protein
MQLFGKARQQRTFAQWFCLIAGAVLIARAASVLLTGAGFGLPGTGWHAGFHLVSGLLLVGAQGRPSLAYPAAVGFALAYGAITIAGILNGHDVLGVISVGTKENAVHAAYVVAALAVVALGPVRAPRPKHA